MLEKKQKVNMRVMLLALFAMAFLWVAISQTEKVWADDETGETNYFYLNNADWDVTASASPNSNGGSWKIYYEITDNSEMTITRGKWVPGLSDSEPFALKIPQGVSFPIGEDEGEDKDYYRITAIGKESFQRCSDLKSFDGTSFDTGCHVKIGERAFAGCANLAEIMLGGSLNSGGSIDIGKEAFAGCTSLKTAELKDTVTEIEYGAFLCCTSLKTATLGTAGAIGDYAFAGTAVTKTEATNYSSYHIGTGAYINGTALVNELNNDTTTNSLKADIHEILNQNSTEYEKVVEAIKQNATALQWVIFPFPGTDSSGKVLPGLGKIGEKAFAGCEGLRGTYQYDSVNEEQVAPDLWNLSFPSSLTSIGASAFEGCKNIAYVTFAYPSECTSIGVSAFAGCSNLTGSWKTSDDPSVNEEAVGLTLPDKLTEIAASTFQGCKKLTSVIITTNSVTSIGASAFQDTGLTEITIPSGVTSIGDSSFQDCKALTSVIISEGVTSIGDNAFNGCSTLASLGVPESVGSIGENAFSNCKTGFYLTYSTGSYAETYAKKYGLTSPSGGSSTGTNGGSSTGTNGDPSTGTNGDPSTGTNGGEKKAQTIAASSVKKAYGTKPFKLEATTNGDGTLSYQSSNSKIAKVDKNSGLVTIKATGSVGITIKASETSQYAAAQKTITLKVTPGKVKGVKAASKKAGRLTVKWKKASGASGYQIAYAGNKTFTKDKKTVLVNKAKATSKTVKKLKRQKTYYVKVRAYKKVGSKKLYGAYSKAAMKKVK